MRTVKPEVARFTRVCAYDRAGLGYSDTGPSPRTAERIARELALLLDRAGETGPVVMTAASLGAFSARVLASTDAERVAGLVLVDASHEDQTLEVPPVAPYAGLLASIGVFRVLDVSFSGEPDQVAPAVRDFARATRLRTTAYSAPASELRHASQSAEQVKATRRVLSIPLVVLTGAYGNTGQWKQLQLDQLRLSTRSCQIVAEQSGHNVPLAQPQAVTQAVRLVVNAARKESQGPPCASTDVNTPPPAS
jgi:pimeloyl-ACP methyl ester carboxylesterase